MSSDALCPSQGDENIGRFCFEDLPDIEQLKDLRLKVIDTAISRLIGEANAKLQRNPDILFVTVRFDEAGLAYYHYLLSDVEVGEYPESISTFDIFVPAEKSEQGKVDLELIRPDYNRKHIIVRKNVAGNHGVPYKIDVEEFNIYYEPSFLEKQEDNGHEFSELLYGEEGFEYDDLLFEQKKLTELSAAIDPDNPQSYSLRGVVAKTYDHTIDKTIEQFLKDGLT